MTKKKTLDEAMELKKQEAPSAWIYLYPEGTTCGDIDEELADLAAKLDELRAKELEVMRRQDEAEYFKAFPDAWIVVDEERET